MIFYGSQSGTSQRLAQLLGHAIDRQFSKSVCIASLADYESSSIAEIARERLVIFILSTYGEGEPPDNALSFYDWLQKGRDTRHLEGLRFSILGLGSSNYKSYNQFARSTFDLLCNSGAAPILELSLTDDALGLAEEGYHSWVTNLFQALVDNFGMQEMPRPYEPSLRVDFCDENCLDESIYTPTQKPETKGKRANTSLGLISCLPVLETRYLTNSLDRPVFHLEFDLSARPELKYATGDHLGLWPENEETEVQKLLGKLDIPSANFTKYLNIQSANRDSFWNPVWDGPITIHALFKRHLEIAAPVSRDFIKDLQQFAPTATAKLFLDSLLSDGARYMHYRSTCKITLGSLLQDACPDQLWQIPISFLLERVPAMRPRYYSIASASSVTPRRIAITVSLNTIPLKNTRETVKGLASHYLLRGFIAPQKAAAWPISEKGESGSSLKVEKSAFCHIRKSKFRMPAASSQPIIMIATGSGIAPFRGFVQHMMKQAKLGKELGQTILIFGCRAPADHLYKEELDSAAEQLSGKLLLFTAYSQNGEESSYVQDKIKEQDLVTKMIVEEDASLYICGSTGMARNASQALRDTLYQRYKWSGSEFAAFELTKKKARRWQADVWG